jgi:ABC-type transport system involved in cytochrome c biogenesis permease subunit
MIPLANHSASTIFAAVVALLPLLLPNNRPQTRYWLWLAASVKFLVPFSLPCRPAVSHRWRTAPAMPMP